VYRSFNFLNYQRALHPAWGLTGACLRVDAQVGIDAGLTWHVF